jgi:hypothetical protein
LYLPIQATHFFKQQSSESGSFYAVGCISLIGIMDKIKILIPAIASIKDGMLACHY